MPKRRARTEPGQCLLMRLGVRRHTVQTSARHPISMNTYL